MNISHTYCIMFNVLLLIFAFVMQNDTVTMVVMSVIGIYSLVFLLDTLVLKDLKQNR